MIQQASFDPKRFIGTIEKLKIKDNDRYAIRITNQVSSLALPILMKRFAPLSKCVPLYILNSNDRSAHQEFGRYKDFVGRIGIYPCIF